MTGEAAEREPEQTTRFIFRGRVQGVWFRKTTRQISSRFAVTGFVRNLADGSVEVVARGTPSEIQAFVEAIHEAYRNNISECVSTPADDVGPLTGFEIR